MNRPSRAIGLQRRADASPWAGKAADGGGQQGVKKQAILRAAAALFRERGYERTRLDDIAQALNVTKPTLYYYVKNKEDILVEILQTGFGEIRRELTGLDRNAQSGAAILRLLVMRCADWVTGEFGVCVTRNFLTTRAPENFARLRKAHRVVERELRKTITLGIEDGSLRPCEPWIVAAAILGSLNWMAFWYEAAPERRSAAELGAAYLDLFIEGIGTTDKRPGAARVRGGGGAPPAKAGHAAVETAATAKPRVAAQRRSGRARRKGAAA
jgi:AcrR family transcriptional regulator